MHCSDVMSSFFMLLHQQGGVTKYEGTGLEQVRNAFKYSMGQYGFSFDIYQEKIWKHWEARNP